MHTLHAVISEVYLLRINWWGRVLGIRSLLVIVRLAVVYSERMVLLLRQLLKSRFDVLEVADTHTHTHTHTHTPVLSCSFATNNRSRDPTSGSRGKSHPVGCSRHQLHTCGLLSLRSCGTSVCRLDTVLNNVVFVLVVLSQLSTCAWFYHLAIGTTAHTAGTALASKFGRVAVVY